MAAPPTDTFQTYQAIGNREDLIDVITNISPMDTWFTQNSGSERAEARRHEWQTDALAAPGANAFVEGEDAVNVAVVPTARVANSCQIVRKVYQVSDTQEAVAKAGRASEIDYQSMKSMKELARDIEYALVINSAEVTGASATARQLKGLLGWIATNVTTGSGTGDETLTESMLNDNLQLIWAQGGFPTHVLAGAFQKRTISGFTTNTRDVAADEKKLVRAVDIFKSDFGDLQIRLHQILNTTAPEKLIILGDMGLWKKAWLRPIVKTPLAKTGAAQKYMIEAELTLESRQEKGSGKIVELATS